MIEWLVFIIFMIFKGFLFQQKYPICVCRRLIRQKCFSALLSRPTIAYRIYCNHYKDVRLFWAQEIHPLHTAYWLHYEDIPFTQITVKTTILRFNMHHSFLNINNLITARKVGFIHFGTALKFFRKLNAL